MSNVFEFFEVFSYFFKFQKTYRVYMHPGAKMDFCVQRYNNDSLMEAGALIARARTNGRQWSDTTSISQDKLSSDDQG